MLHLPPAPLRVSFACVHVGLRCPKKPTHSSNIWMERQRKDNYVWRAQQKSYRARSAFKLIQINDTHKLLKPGFTVVDCGAKPGAWSQVAVERVNSLSQTPNAPVGKVISVDINLMSPLRGSVFVLGDLTAPETQEAVMEKLAGAKADLIMSDMAPNATGDPAVDQDRIVSLCLAALHLAVKSSALKQGGNFVCKVWQGPDTDKLQEILGQLFHKVAIVKPDASRSDSSEIFLLARKLRGYYSQ